MSLAGLSLRDLEYLVAVAELRHFGRAASRCGVSQPALSAQLRKLEALLGTQVFERGPGRVLVTPRGEAVVEAARQVIAQARALLAVARAGEGPLSGPLRIGALPTLGPYLLPRVLRPLREAFPELRPILSEERSAGLVAALRSDGLDVALACLPLPDPALTLHPLFREPLLLMHPPEVAPRWPLEETGARLVLLGEGHCLTDQTLALCGPAVPRAGRHATGLEMVRHMVAAGEGVALVPALAAASLGTMDGLLAYSPLGAAIPAMGREVALAHRRSDPRAPQFATLAALLRGLAPPPAEPLPAG
ncbi:LysR substrate-binding domain-containing protein [Roseomonas sp. OT10]|uniref:LysR substrate-binding domain-containing protein n=1 Tax=Roseomonas cutis TaxID=2897332 RepID=UPI001E57BC8A|nr:LysR substrate-binding domain-containing protein [Roseomonas sp. OT10]UFN48171.1 LysR substrate-binding domain-containing protein [Roseomonas sp. OT10]